MPVTFLDALYALCCLALLGMAAFVLFRAPKVAPNRWFAVTCLFLLAWLVTLFLFHREPEPASALLMGRLNFAAVPPAALAAYLFVRAVAGLPTMKRSSSIALWTGAALLSLVSACTALVDSAETPANATSMSPRYVTVYGPLFSLYVAFVAALLLAAVLLAFGQARIARRPTHDQLLLVGSGMLATGLVALVANALLPYVFADFRLTDAGALSTVLFLAAVAYAIAQRGLFDIRLLVRKTVVYGLLLSFLLAAYSTFVVLVTDRFAGPDSGMFTRVAVLVLAFSTDPVRRFLEARVDRFLSPARRAHRR